ncbi:hypothetical protein [Priestia koreensis]|uniref:hypothetical protein n=1 Tax=Priestia koreensis TaxID=284581 RepID=UPI0034599F09
MKKTITTLMATIAFASIALIANPADSMAASSHRTYTYWTATDSAYVGAVHKGWETNGTYKGPSVASLSEDIEHGIELSGSVLASRFTIGKALGFSASATSIDEAHWSVKVPKGKTYTLRYREVYKKYKFKQVQYKDVGGKKSPTSKAPKYAYAEKFDHYEYGYTVK